MSRHVISNQCQRGGDEDHQDNKRYPKESRYWTFVLPSGRSHRRYYRNREANNAEDQKTGEELVHFLFEAIWPTSGQQYSLFLLRSPASHASMVGALRATRGEKDRLRSRPLNIQLGPLGGCKPSSGRHFVLAVIAALRCPLWVVHGRRVQDQDGVSSMAVNGQERSSLAIDNEAPARGRGNELLRLLTLDE